MGRAIVISIGPTRRREKGEKAKAEKQERSGDVEKRLEFEGRIPLYVLHPRASLARVVCRHVAVRVAERGKKGKKKEKRKEKEMEEREKNRHPAGRTPGVYELSEHGLIPEAGFTSVAYGYCCYL